MLPTQKFAALLLPDKAPHLASLQYESKGAAGRYSLWEVVRFETPFTPWVCLQSIPFTFQAHYKAWALLIADMGLCLCATAQIAEIANASSIEL